MGRNPGCSLAPAAYGFLDPIGRLYPENPDWLSVVDVSLLVALLWLAGLAGLAGLVA